MSKHRLPQRKRLAAIFASFTILIMGTMSLLESMSLDYYSVLSTLQKIIPASIIIGGLGWIMGMILDKPKRRNRLSYNSLFTKNLAESAKGSEGSDTALPDVSVSELQ